MKEVLLSYEIKSIREHKKHLKIQDLTFCKLHMYLVTGPSDFIEFYMYLIDKMTIE